MLTRLIHAASIAALALLAACSARSPDLPVPKLVSGPVVSCVPQGPISTGQTSQCTATQCVFETIDASGNANQVPGQCPAVTWSTSPTSVGTIDGNGLLTGVGAGIVTAVATVEGGSGSTTVAVNAACVGSIAITPTNATLIAGQNLQYTATATFSDNHQANVTQQTTWTSGDTNTATIDNKGLAHGVAASATPVTITGSYAGTNICSGTASPIVQATTVTVSAAQLIANGLCIEPAADAASQFTGCRADTGACASTATPVNLTIGQTAPFRLRGRFNNGQECNLTNDPKTTWGSSAPTVATVSSAGLATGVAAGTGSATATYTDATANPANVTAAPYPLKVSVSQVLTKDSLRVSAKPYTVTDTPRKFACVGATDIVGSLEDSSQIQGRLKVFAGARFCATNQVNADGTCKQFTGNAISDVTNDDGVTVTTPNANRIVWSQSSSYWNGNACVSTLQGALDSIAKGPTGVVGDTYTPAARYATGDRQPGENGVVVGTGDVRVGFACITAEYTNPQLATNKASDGMTVLVLPVTNDVLLGPSSANDATHLCDALEPLFQMTASDNGGNGALTQLLSAVTEIVNPIAQNVADGSEPGGPLPVTTIVTQVLTALSDNATSQVFAAGLTNAVNTVDTGVYSPVVCALGSLLNAITTQDPASAANAQACLPTP
ncbi:MAG TPA: Ig-like domain-containing protein [Nevskiaceae bacterium]|nr:Ig-like domain-containing protein [Nevskiaceae bacterium]